MFAVVLSPAVADRKGAALRDAYLDLRHSDAPSIVLIVAEVLFFSSYQRPSNSKCTNAKFNFHDIFPLFMLLSFAV